MSLRDTLDSMGIRVAHGTNPVLNYLGKCVLCERDYHMIEGHESENPFICKCCGAKYED